MTAITVTCPNCGRRLTVSDAAPMQLTCPRCLAKIDRPASSQPGAQQPMRVLPVETQVGRDSRGSIVALIPLAGLLVLGLLVATGAFARSPVIWIGLVGVIVSAIIAFAMNRPKPPRALDAAPASAPNLNPSRSGSPIIEYRTPRPGGGRGHPGSSLGAFFSGLFSAIAVCAACFLFLAATAGSGNGHQPLHGLYLLLVLGAVIATCIGGASMGGRWPGFGAGIAAGMCLGLLALAPCGVCYLTTI